MQEIASNVITAARIWPGTPHNEQASLGKSAAPEM